MNEQELAPQPKKGGKLAVLAVLAVIILLFVFFLKDIMIPLIRLEMRHDLAGVQELLAEARKWEIRHGGVSGRTAKQFIHYIAGRESKR